MPDASYSAEGLINTCEANTSFKPLNIYLLDNRKSCELFNMLLK